MNETLEYHYNFMGKTVMILLLYINRQVYGQTFISIAVFLPCPHRPPFRKTVNYIETADRQICKENKLDKSFVHLFHSSRMLTSSPL